MKLAWLVIRRGLVLLLLLSVGACGSKSESRRAPLNDRGAFTPPGGRS
jgi:hypothetical protein